MAIWAAIQNYFAGKDPLTLWLIGFVVSGIVYGIVSGFFKARKIQPNGFRWRTFRNEVIFTIINVAIATTMLGYIRAVLEKYGFITYNDASAAGWIIGLEFAAYFFLFDAYFYWLHRLMHKEPMYKWVHKLHHFSTSPNLMTTASVTPLESLINGGFVPLFLAVLTVHTESLPYILATNLIMGPYVHSGYEFFPRWWNKSWATKWFITATFHDQHHKFFNWNFGGYTTIWDRLCGTMRPKFEADYDQLKARLDQPLSPAVAATNSSSQ